MQKQVLKAELYKILKQPEFEIDELENIISKYRNQFKTQDEIILNDVIDSAVKCFEIEKESLFDPTRKQKVVMARYFIFWFYRHHSFLSLTAIGRIFKKDHATVLHGLRSLKNDFDSNYKPTIEKYNKFCEFLELKEIQVKY